jgi:hypothetical protein
MRAADRKDALPIYDFHREKTIAGGPGRIRTYNQQIVKQQLKTNDFSDFPRLILVISRQM